MCKEVGYVDEASFEQLQFSVTIWSLLIRFLISKDKKKILIWEKGILNNFFIKMYKFLVYVALTALRFFHCIDNRFISKSLKIQNLLNSW